MVARSHPPAGISEKIFRLVSGCGWRRRISKMAARGPVILRDCRRSRPVKADISCRFRECECACAFMSVPKSHREFPKSSELQTICRLSGNFRRGKKQKAATGGRRPKL
jgi:hypothetical protein